MRMVSFLLLFFCFFLALEGIGCVGSGWTDLIAIGSSGPEGLDEFLGSYQSKR